MKLSSIFLIVFLSGCSLVSLPSINAASGACASGAIDNFSHSTAKGDRTNFICKEELP